MRKASRAGAPSLELHPVNSTPSFSSATTELGAKAVKYSPAFIVLRVGWELTAGDRFEGEIKAASNFARKAWQSGQAALGFWSEIREFMRELSSATEAEVTQFLITGEFPGADKVGPSIELAIFTAISLHVQAMEWWNGLDPCKRGYYRGYILFEVVAAVAAGLLTAPAGGAGAAVVLARHGPKLGQVLRKISEGLSRLAAKAGDNLAPILSKLDEMVSSITGARAGGWCFVAGTTILTAQGAVPIEQVREGDFVWSAHESKDWE